MTAMTTIVTRTTKVMTTIGTTTIKVKT